MATELYVACSKTDPSARVNVKLMSKQAEIVRRIFAEYAAGISPRRIARGLNAEGIPGPRGGLWNASTINGSRQRRNGILNNELYRGQITYNRQRFVKDPDTGKRIARPNPEDQWIKTEVAHLRIIDDRLWEAAQILKSRYSSQTGNKRQTRKRLLSGLVKCGACGGSMTIVNRERYSCSAKRERGTCDSPAGISAVELEERVLSGLKDLLLGNETLIEAFAEEFKAELERLNRQRGSARRRLQKELNKVNGAINRCVIFIKEGDGSPNIVREELHALEIRTGRATTGNGCGPSQPSSPLPPRDGRPLSQEGRGAADIADERRVQDTGNGTDPVPDRMH